MPYPPSTNNRTTASAPIIAEPHTIVLFDGACNLCSGAVRFLIARDPSARFRFAALQSEAAQAACARAGHELRATRTPDTVVVIQDGRALERSDAALAIVRHLPFPWPLLGAFRALPRGMRDAMYGFVAGNRHRWFGRSESCTVPSPELRGRFLD